MDEFSTYCILRYSVEMRRAWRVSECWHTDLTHVRIYMRVSCALKHYLRVFRAPTECHSDLWYAFCAHTLRSNAFMRSCIAL